MCKYNKEPPSTPLSRRQDFFVQISICLFYHQIIPPFQHAVREAPKENFFNKHFEPLKMMRAMFINEICPFNEQWNPFSEKELQAVWQNFKAPLYFILFYRLISNKNQPLFWISQEEPKVPSDMPNYVSHDTSKVHAGTLNMGIEFTLKHLQAIDYSISIQNCLRFKLTIHYFHHIFYYSRLEKAGHT